MQNPISKQIKEFKRLLEETGRSGIALDVDDTLSATFRFWVEELHKRHGSAEGLTPDEMISKYRYLKEIPYWQTDEVYKWIVEQIESSDHQINLPLIEDAQHIVAEINQITPVMAYISSRPESTME